MKDARTIQETREVVTAIVSAFDKWHRANADGHVSFIEWLGFAQLLPEMFTALQRSSEIPKELADLDGLEADELIEMVATTINQQISTHEMRLKIDKILIAFHAIADAQAQWRGVNPPRPEIVP